YIFLLIATIAAVGGICFCVWFLFLLLSEFSGYAFQLAFFSPFVVCLFALALLNLTLIDDVIRYSTAYYQQVKIILENGEEVTGRILDSIEDLSTC
ncbi:MAG: hypothetical protein QXL61_05300, partial [Archaeoglobaceae archaeon]